MKKPAVVIVLVLLLSSISLIPGPVKSQGSKWTFMVYLDADNNLEDVGIDDFLSMATVGSSDDVKIVVQFDRNSNYDNRYDNWDTTKRFLVAKDMIPTGANALEDLGEMNMADPATLQDFVIWAASAYPADHYFLDLWDHGFGWQGVAIDNAPIPSDVLTTEELANALQEITTFIGRPLDILANDACRMTLEIMYQVRNYSTYLVGSEKDEPLEGWPYDRVLGPLVQDPTMSPFSLASLLVDEYIEYYRSGSSYSVTMAVVNSSRLQDVVQRLNGLVSAVNFSLPYSTWDVVDARNASEHYEGNQCVSPQAGEDYDLYDVATKLADYVASGRVRYAATAVHAVISDAVLYEKHLNISNPVNCVKAEDAHGLALWYPWSLGSKQTAYEGLEFSRDSLWDEYLGYYHNWTNGTVQFTATLTISDENLDGRNDTATIISNATEDGSVFLDIYQDENHFLTTSFGLTAGVAHQTTVTLPVAAKYDFYLAFRQQYSTVNATSFTGIVISTNLTIRGIIRITTGMRIDGALVTLTNQRTNITLTSTSTQGIYTFIISYPEWVRNEDILVVTADKDGKTSTKQFTVSYHGQSLIWVDLFLEPPDGVDSPEQSIFGDNWPILVLLLVAIILELLILLWIIRSSWGIGSESKKT